MSKKKTKIDPSLKKVEDHQVVMPRLMSVTDVANYLRVHKQTIYNWHWKERMPVPLRMSPLKGRLRWRADVIDQWINTGMPDRSQYDGRHEPDVSGPR